MPTVQPSLSPVKPPDEELPAEVPTSGADASASATNGKGWAADITGLTEAERPEARVWDLLDRVPDRYKDGARVSVGRPRSTLRNVVTILNEDARWTGRVRYSLFDGQTHLTPDRGGSSQPIRDTDESRAAVWLSTTYSLDIVTERVSEAMRLVAADHAFHPVREYLDGLVWDGTVRLQNLLSAYFGAAPTILHALMSSGWGVGCQARIAVPGCKMDTVLILVGGQGQLKSSAFRALALRDEWFADTRLEIGNKDALAAMAGTWIYEMPELDSIRSREASTTKAFLSSQVDRFRPSYGRNIVRLPRQTVIVGSTNEAEFLTDHTGSRRFWPVQIGRIDIDAIMRDREQIWAEAGVRYREGEPWWLDAADEADREVEAGEFTPEDAWESLIADWVQDRTHSFSVQDVLAGPLQIEPGRQVHAQTGRVGRILARLHCQKTQPRTSAGARIRLYSAPIHEEGP